jgi:hypothetical protein
VLAPHRLAHEPERLVRAGERRDLVRRAGRRDEHVPRLELRVHAIRARAEEVLARGDLPDYPEEMRETFARLMAEHGIDTGKYLGG